MHSAVDAQARKRRQKGLESFVLALSDQQLVVGFAVLIAGFMGTCSMSIYHFNIVASLAWFSSATHLATLGVLQKYLIDRPTIRDWRVVAMLLLSLMLIVARIPAGSYQYIYLPVSCAFSSKLIQPGLSYVATIGFLVVRYSERIARLYTWDADWTLSGFVIEILIKKVLARIDYREPSYKGIAKAGTDAHIPACEISGLIRVERRKFRFDHFETVMKLEHAPLTSRMLASLFVAKEFTFSFISQVLVLVFEITYGFTQTMMVRSNMSINAVKGDQNKMGFGQLVPLFLLLLPGLAVGELYFGESGLWKALKAPLLKV